MTIVKENDKEKEMFKKTTKITFILMILFKLNGKNNMIS